MRAMLFVIALSGCTGGELEPAVEITAPADGATTGADVTITVEVTDFALVDPESARRARRPVWTPLDLFPAAYAHDPSADPEGYVEYSVDGDVVATTTDLSFAVTGLAAGAHTIEVELYYPDGDAFFPAVTDEVTITVE